MQSTLQEIVKIQSRGVFTIPKKVRKNLGLADDSLVKVTIEKGRLVLEPIRILPFPVRSYTEEDIADFIKLDKEESKALKIKGLL